MRAIRIYLDSSDYSVLSDPRRCTGTFASILHQLRSIRDEGLATFHFSGILLSEMAPLDPEFTDAAQRRADLLVELCGQNCLISQDRLFAGELRFAGQDTDDPPSIYSSSGEWYPEGIAEISPIGAVAMATNIKEAISDFGLGRKARREAERKALKGGKPRPAVQSSLIANARAGSLDEILQIYPMRPDDARILGRFVVGDATAAQAAAAFEGSLRDPRWMMQWFERHHSKLSHFIEWTRGPAASMILNLNDLAEHAATLRRMDLERGTSMAASILSSKGWSTQQDELLLRVSKRICKELLGFDNPNLSPKLIDEKCAGISVGIRSLHSAWWTTTSKTPRPAKLSDFPDALHAMYAPYVDIFRADSFMAPYIDKNASRFGTTTIGKLVDLPNAIQVARSRLNS